MNTPWVSIIIVNYNAGDFLQKAIDAVQLQTDVPFEIILVDNASEDGSLASLKTDQISNLKTMALPTNVGFAAANNIAAKTARGEWIALLNPDAAPRPGWLAAFKTATETYPDTTMFAGATLSMQDPEILDGAGDYYYSMGIPWRGGYGHPSSELPETGECFSPCGANALYKRDTFLDIGGFDERYFCYCEDVDLAFRLRLEGHRCIFLPDAAALHYGSGTTSVASDFVVYHGTRNRLWTFVKNMPPLGLALGMPIHVLLTLVLLVRAIPGGRGRSTWRGLVAGVSGIGPIWKARKQVHKRRKLSTRQIWRAMSWRFRTLRQRGIDIKPIEKSR